MLPVESVGDIPAGQQLKVVVMWEAGSADSAWDVAGRARFEEANCAEDVVYEQLIHEAPGCGVLSSAGGGMLYGAYWGCGMGSRIHGGF